MARISGDPRNKQNVNIFIVDDNELDAQVRKQEFELNTNYDVETFNTGEQFLKFLIDNPPHKKSISIVILDYILNSTNLDAQNGIEILKRIKSLNMDYEVIMISSVPDVDIVTSAIHYGAVTFIKKNENAFLRMQNNINWIISKKALKRQRTSTIGSILMFLIILVGMTLIFGVLYTYFPDWFRR